MRILNRLRSPSPACSTSSTSMASRKARISSRPIAATSARCPAARGGLSCPEADRPRDSGRKLEPGLFQFAEPAILGPPGDGSAPMYSLP